MAMVGTFYFWPVAQAGWLSPKFSGHLVLCWMRRMNRLNSHNRFAMMTAL